MQYQKICYKCLNIFPTDRLRDIFARRYGLKDGKRETLESIGKSYNITRERVRQIEESNLDYLRKIINENFELQNTLNAVYTEISQYIDEYGRVISERRLFNEVTGYDEYHPENASLSFLLIIKNDKFYRVYENNHFYSHWTIEKAALKNFQKFIDSVIAMIAKKGQPISYEEFLPSLTNQHNLKQKVIENYLNISKRIGKNIFNEIGLSHWPEITPRKVRDKIYLIFKKINKPLHFKEIAEQINSLFKDGKKAYPQTVHNELIKDEKYVLVGRGIYAPKHWGYIAGTIKDVIKKILEDAKKPLPKEEIISKVLKQRIVSPTTILINLNSPDFIESQDGYYLNKTETI